MTASIAAFIFDMDGTLADNMPFHAQAWGQFFHELGVPFDTRQVETRLAGRNNREILRVVLGDQISPQDLAQLSGRKEAIYRDLYRPVMKPIDCLQPFLQEAQRREIPMAVATSAGRRNTQFLLTGLEIDRFFRVVVDADDVTVGKPDPQMFLTAAQRLGVAPESCLVFEDALLGLEAARRANMRSVALTTTNPAEILQSVPGVVRVIDNYCSLDPMDLLDGKLS